MMCLGETSQGSPADGEESRWPQLGKRQASGMQESEQVKSLSMGQHLIG